LTIATATSGQRKNAVLKVEVVNEACLAKAFGNLLGLFVFGFEGVDQIQANKVCHLHFNGHGATVGSTGVAHTGLVASPTLDAIDIDNANG
jgi:hypothetical protein